MDISAIKEKKRKEEEEEGRGRKRRNLRYYWEKRKKAFCTKFNPLGCLNPEKEEKIRRKLGGGEMAGRERTKMKIAEFVFLKFSFWRILLSITF